MLQSSIYVSVLLFIFSVLFPLLNEIIIPTLKRDWSEEVCRNIPLGLSEGSPYFFIIKLFLGEWQLQVPEHMEMNYLYVR